MQFIYDRKTGKSHAYGLVTMSTVEEAEKVVDMHNLRMSIFDN